MEALVPKPLKNLDQKKKAGFLFVVLFASGFAGLGYQVLWSRMLAVALGHEIAATLAVVGAFFAGLALGSHALSDRIRNSGTPGRWYVALEIAIAVWAVALMFAIPFFNETLPRWMGTEPAPWRQWLVGFGATFLLLGPATFAMGGTLPAMEQYFAGCTQRDRAVGSLYGVNTLGAMVGTLVTAFVLIPQSGLSTNLALMAGLNLLAAGLVLLMGRERRPATGRRPVRAAPLSANSLRLRITLLFTGFLGIGYEVLVIRALSQVLENTLFTFAAILAVYLLGTGIGALVYQRYLSRAEFAPWLSRLLASTGLACLIGVVALTAIPNVNDGLIQWLGYGRLQGAVSEFLVAALVFALPTVSMGATFSHLAQAARDEIGLGKALALNTVGAALAPLAFGVWLLPALGIQGALIAASLGYLLVVPVPVRRAEAWLPVGVAAAGMVAAILPLNLSFLEPPPGGRIVSQAEGALASVAVVEDSSGTRYLKVNNHFTMGSSASGFSDRRQAHIPLLLHPEPTKALFLGLGTGSTYVAAAAHPGLQATAVELLPEIVPTLAQFGPSAEAIEKNPRLDLVVGDARRYVRAQRDRYDVVIADVFHPARDGASSLYTREHFAAIRSRLNDGGLFCQWLPLFQLDIPTLRTITRTFLQVFPDAQAYLAHFSLGQPLVGLVGFSESPSFGPGWIERRIQGPLGEDLRRLRLDDDFALFGGYLAAAAGLTKFAGSGPINTDDHPVVAYQAPDFVYRGPEPAVDRLLTLIEEFAPDVAYAGFSEAENFAPRLGDYWKARNAYLRAGVGVTPTNDLGEMLGQVRDPLLEVLALSSDFAPAYDPLLRMAFELHAHDPEAAQTLLARLNQLSPERGEARALGARLGIVDL